MSITPERLRQLSRRGVQQNDGQDYIVPARYIVEYNAALRAAADQLEAVRKALDESIPPYNSELRPDGSEDPIMAAYVDGVKDVYLPLDAILTSDTAPQETP